MSALPVLSSGPGWRVVLDSEAGRVRTELDLSDCIIEIRDGHCAIELPSWLFHRIVVESQGRLVPQIPGTRTQTVLAIQQEVAAFYVVSLSVIVGDSRRSSPSRFRHVAMYLARKLTDQSFPELGIAFGRDQSTVQHAVRKIERALSTDDDLGRQIKILEDRLVSPPVLVLAR